MVDGEVVPRFCDSEQRWETATTPNAASLRMMLARSSGLIWSCCRDGRRAGGACHPTTRDLKRRRALSATGRSTNSPLGRAKPPPPAASNPKVPIRAHSISASVGVKISWRMSSCRGWYCRLTEKAQRSGELGLVAKSLAVSSSRGKTLSMGGSIPAARDARTEMTAHRGLQVPAGRVEVALQVDTTHREKPHTGYYGDLKRSQDTARAFYSTDNGLTGRPRWHGPDIACRFNLGDPDTQSSIRHRVEIRFTPSRLGCVHPDPGGWSSSASATIARAVTFASGGTASSRSSITASAPA